VRRFLESPEMKQFRSEQGGARLLALALIGVIGLGAYALIVRKPETRIVVVAPPKKPVLSTYAPAAKVVADAVPATPKAQTAPAAAAPAPRPSVSVRPAQQRPAEVRPASKTPAVTRSAAPAPEPPPEGISGTTRASTDLPPPPPEPLVISDAQIVALSPSTAQITWRTNLPATTRASYGIDSPTVWTSPTPPGTLEHQTVVTGLSFSTTYQVWLHALDEYNQTQTAVVNLTTEPMPNRTIATTSGDRILLDGQPFFPIAVWAQCSDGYGSNVADGINLFMGDGCGREHQDRRLAAQVSGRAYSIVDADNAAADGRGVIGWYMRDEWDAFLESNVTLDELRQSIPDAQPGRISFLTLTNHFYSKAAPLPQGRGMYPALYSLADVVGFDLYPLQVWCKPAFGDVLDAQNELNANTNGKPTFQWIETAPMEHACADNPSLDPTAATVRAETWLAVAGGADGIGYFPNRWRGDIGAEITRTNRQIQSLAPALLSPHVPATTNTPAIRVSARSLNGALYVIAVNTGYDAVQVKINAEGIGGRSATILGEGTVVGSDDTGFTDTFAPLAAKVFVIPPQGW
jgi:hypothetical protein